MIKTILLIQIYNVVSCASILIVKNDAGLDIQANEHYNHILEFILNLVSDDASLITDAEVVIDGGIVMM